MSNLDSMQFSAPLGDNSVFGDMEVAVENYNNATDHLEKLKQLKYIYEKFFDYLNLDKNDGVLLALLETSTFFASEKHKLQFDRDTCTLRSPFHMGDRLLFRPVAFNRLFFTSFNTVSDINVSNTALIDGQNMNVTTKVTGENGRIYQVAFNPDGTIDSYITKELGDNSLEKVIQNTTHCYEEGFIKIVRPDNNESKFYDFGGNEMNFDINDSSSVRFSVIFSPVIPYFGRDLSNKTKTILDENTNGILFPNLVSRMNIK